MWLVIGLALLRQMPRWQVVQEMALTLDGQALPAPSAGAQARQRLGAEPTAPSCTPARDGSRNPGKGYGPVRRQKREDVHTIYELVSANQADAKGAGVQTMCRVVGISSSGHYDWLRRLPSRRTMDNAVLILGRRARCLSRQVVGWAMGEQMTAALVVSALNMALHTRKARSGTTPVVGTAQSESRAQAAVKRTARMPILPPGASVRLQTSRSRCSRAAWQLLRRRHR